MRLLSNFRLVVLVVAWCQISLAEVEFQLSDQLGPAASTVESGRASATADPALLPTDLLGIRRIDETGVPDRDSFLTLIQGIDDSVPNDSGRSSTMVERGPESSTGFGWLGNVFSSGMRTYISVSPLVGLNNAFIESRSDAASLFESVIGISVPKRNEGFGDPISQGRRNPQAPARGSYWIAAREDMDTILSKIDSRLVEEAVAINGPYSALYGPGLAFYDVRLLQAPRYHNGFESHGSTSLEFDTNGERWYGRQDLWGGAEDWGYRVGYGHRTGNDYTSGGGTEFLSSYNTRMFDVAIGADLTSDSHLDISVLRLDQTDIEFPGQFFDIDFLVTDAYEATYRVEDQFRYDELEIEAWYNRTRFAGNARNVARKVPNVFFLDDSTTDVDAMSTGYRMSVGWKDLNTGDLLVGTDLRYLKQRLNEFNSGIRFPIPRSHSINPGIFVENQTEIDDRLRVTTGARADWISTNADEFIDGLNRDLEAALLGEFDQHFALWSAFATAEYRLNACWTVEGGFGHSMRPPSMTELYADDPFVAVLPQKILSSVLGNPSLSEERMWQIDLGLNADLQRLQAGIHGFHSWVNDYITLDLITGTGVPQYSYVNTDLATIAGFDIYSNYKLSSWLKTFSTTSYVEGRDHDRGRISLQRTIGSPRSGNDAAEQPLPVFAPLEQRLGLVLHEPTENPLWSVEFVVRVVDAQDRVASILLEEPTPGYALFDIRGYAQLTQNLLMTAAVENVTDAQYQTYYDARNEGVVFQPGINFNFGTLLTY